MSDNTDYSPEEWRDLTVLAGIGIGRKVLKKANTFTIRKIFSTVKEAFSYQQTLGKLEQKYPDNQLIADIIKGLQKEKENNAFNNKSELMNDVKFFEPLIDRVNDALKEKSNEKEAGEYRAFVYELSCEVCKAAGGGFLGLSSEIDAEEAQFLKKLKAALLENQG
ncbi:MAG: hypothetical protein ACQETH_06190 [Candidatus Rifleibacteriota bacterium]